MSRPTSLAVEQPNAKKSLTHPGPETFPTPMEEPRKVVKAWYLGSLQVMFLEMPHLKSVTNDQKAVYPLALLLF